VQESFKECRGQETYEVSERRKLRSDNVPRMQMSSPKLDQAQRGAKVEAFENLKIFQV
jgi:hypothetical protein